MKFNAVGWFDIYVNDMDRAVVFYESILQEKLEEIKDPTGESMMMSFKADMGFYGAGGALVKSENGKPGVGGTLLYFSVGDCAEVEPLVLKAGGQVLKSKFSIGEYGYVALCLDTEGNTFGLSSMN